MLIFIPKSKRRFYASLLLFCCAAVLSLVACQQKLSGADTEPANSRNNSQEMGKVGEDVNNRESDEVEKSRNNQKTDEVEKDLSTVSGKPLPEKSAKSLLIETLESKTFSGMPIAVESLDLEKATVALNLLLTPDFSIQHFKKNMEECWTDFRSIDIHKASNYELENIVGRKFSVTFKEADGKPLKSIITFTVQKD